MNTMAMPYLSQAFDHRIVPHGTAGLGDVSHAALMRPLDVIREREERVGTQRHAGEPIQPGPFFLPGEYGRFDLEFRLPYAFRSTSSYSSPI